MIFENIRNKGLTIIEAIIYISLLSILMLGMIRYMYELHINSLKLKDGLDREYENMRERGFGSLVAVVLIALGGLAFSISLADSVYLYSDLISKKELRMQASVNSDSCNDVVMHELELNPFLEGEYIVSELGCEVDIVRLVEVDGVRKYKLNIVSEINRVKSYKKYEIEI